MADDKIEIEIVLDDGTVRKGFAKIESDAKQSAKSVKDSFDGSESTFKKLAVTAGGFVAALGAIRLAGAAMSFFADSVKAAAEQNDAIVRLNNSLALSGQYSVEASKSLQDYADQIQKTTAYGDDFALGVANQIQILGRLDSEALKRATGAALDMASALGIDAMTAAEMLGKAANGQVGALSKLGLQIKNTGDNAKTFELALSAIETRFGGSAQNAALTYEGSIKRLGNVWGDLKEQIGKFVTNSPAVAAAIKFIGDKLIEAGKFLQSLGGKDVAKDLLINLAVILQATTDTAVRIGDSFVLAFLRAKQAWIGFKVLTTAGFSDTFNAQLMEVNQQIDDLKNNFGAVGATKFFDEFIMKLSETKGTLTEFGDTGKPVVNGLKTDLEAMNFVATELTSSFTVFGLTFGVVAETATQQMQRMQEVGKQVGSQVQQAFGKLAADGIGRLTKTLITGKNAFKDFGKFILNALGDLAIQIGTTLLTAGIGMLALKALNAAQAIAAGAGLIALGTIMKTIGGGGGSESAAASGAAAGGGFGVSPEAPQVQEQKPVTTVAVNIQGDVLDSNDTGMRIVDLLQQYTDKNGTTQVLA